MTLSVLHVLYTSLPDVTGSSVRSDGLLRGLQEAHVRVTAITSPFQPPFRSGADRECVNGVTVLRTFLGSRSLVVSEASKPWYVKVRKILVLPSFIRSVFIAARATEAHVIHAHGIFFCAIAALVAARLNGVPVVYEIRSLWEERAKGTALGRITIRLTRWVEGLCARNVDAVVVISEGLRRELKKRNIPNRKIILVPNCVHSSTVLQNKNRSWTGSPKSRIDFGYVGNLSAIEGIETLISAFEELKSRNAPRVGRLFIHGGGPMEARVREMTCGSPDIYVGGVFGREDLDRIYESIDVVVIPRTRSRLTETVTPIKPLEAMAFKKYVLLSDLAPMREVAGSAASVRYFTPDSVESLVDSMDAVAALNRAEISRSVEDGWRFLQNERSWEAAASVYIKLYRKLSHEGF